MLYDIFINPILLLIIIYTRTCKFTIGNNYSLNRHFTLTGVYSLKKGTGSSLEKQYFKLRWFISNKCFLPR